MSIGILKLGLVLRRTFPLAAYFPLEYVFLRLGTIRENSQEFVQPPSFLGTVEVAGRL